LWSLCWTVADEAESINHTLPDEATEIVPSLASNTITKAG